MTASHSLPSVTPPPSNVQPLTTLAPSSCPCHTPTHLGPERKREHHPPRTNTSGPSASSPEPCMIKQKYLLQKNALERELTCLGTVHFPSCRTDRCWCERHSSPLLLFPSALLFLSSSRGVSLLHSFPPLPICSSAPSVFPLFSSSSHPPRAGLGSSFARWPGSSRAPIARRGFSFFVQARVRGGIGGHLIPFPG